MRIKNAQLRYYFHIADPDSLTDEDFAARYRELEWLRQSESNK